MSHQTLLIFYSIVQGFIPLTPAYASLYIGLENKQFPHVSLASSVKLRTYSLCLEWVTEVLILFCGTSCG